MRHRIVERLVARSGIVLLAYSVVGAYILGALTLGETFPFSRFRMFSEPLERVSSVVVTTADGTSVRFRDIGNKKAMAGDPQAPGPGSAEASECVAADGTQVERPRHDPKLASALASLGAHDGALAVVEREYRFDPPGSDRLQRVDRVLYTCGVTR
jgi:hypothetical protein